MFINHFLMLPSPLAIWSSPEENLPGFYFSQLYSSNTYLWWWKLVKKNINQELGKMKTATIKNKMKWKTHKFTSILWCAMFLSKEKNAVFVGNSGHIQRKCYLNWYFMTYKGSLDSEEINSQEAVTSHQVHGRAPRRMWLNKQLRWRLSKVLYLCLHGLQGTESDCHNQYASKR